MIGLLASGELNRWLMSAIRFSWNWQAVLSVCPQINSNSFEVSRFRLHCSIFCPGSAVSGGSKGGGKSGHVPHPV